ncbi:MAG: sulfatase-like hydrolase/transferase, partial [Candidatus Sumerlaeota bacterium]|nr:sulfatase-like hydrolase/transferase [Candidatus Sumerlaeota bacterium]
DGGNNRDRVAEGGIVGWSRSRDYDENVQSRSLEYLRAAARGGKAQPFFLFVSFTHPHDPYQTTREYWDRYEGVDIRLPAHWNQDSRTLSPMNQWVQTHHDLHEPVRAEDALKSRRGYYGNCSYVDDKVGELLRELERRGLANNTVVFFASDHGEMLGEHGMWSKRTFYEGASAVPLMMRWPDGRFAGRQVDSVVSLLDVYPTLLELARRPVPGDLDAQSLIPLAAGEAPGRDEAFCEYDGDGVLAPCRMIQRGRYKLSYAYGQKSELFDLEADPDEMHNLIDSPRHAAIRDELLTRLLETWDPAEMDRRIRASQKRRRFIARVRLDGGYPWQFVCEPARPDELRKGAKVGCGAVIPKEKNE